MTKGWCSLSFTSLECLRVCVNLCKIFVFKGTLGVLQSVARGWMVFRGLGSGSLPGHFPGGVPVLQQLYVGGGGRGGVGGGVAGLV